MPPAIAIAGAAVIGAGATIVAGNKAAKAQKKAVQSAANNERYFYDTTRNDFAYARNAGQSATQALMRAYGLSSPTLGSAGSVSGVGTEGGIDSGPYGGFFTSPGYEFRRDEGIKALERSASARGLRTGPVQGLSGPTAKAVMRYGDGLAASEYDAYTARLAQLAGLGNSATAGTAAAGASAAGNISNALIASGNARASSYANTGSAINSGLNNVMTAYLMAGNGGNPGAYGKAF